MGEWSTKDLWIVLVKDSIKDGEQVFGYGDRAKTEEEVIDKAVKALKVPKERLVAVRWEEMEQKKDFMKKTIFGA